MTRDRETLTVEVETDGTASQVRSLLDRLDPDGRLVDRFALRSRTLDDVFLAFTGHATQNVPAQEVTVDA